MSESAKQPDLYEILLNRFRDIVREEIKAALSTEPQVLKDWLTAGEVSKLYGLPKTWFEERGRAGDIARTKPGRYVLFKRRDVEEYLERNKSNNC